MFWCTKHHPFLRSRQSKMWSKGPQKCKWSRGPLDDHNESRKDLHRSVTAAHDLMAIISQFLAATRASCQDCKLDPRLRVARHSPAMESARRFQARNCASLARGWGFQWGTIRSWAGTQKRCTCSPIALARRFHRLSNRASNGRELSLVSKVLIADIQSVTRVISPVTPRLLKAHASLQTTHKASSSARKGVWSSPDGPVAAAKLTEGITTLKAATPCLAAPSVATKICLSPCRARSRNRVTSATKCTKIEEEGAAGRSCTTLAKSRSSTLSTGEGTPSRRSAVWGHTHNKCTLDGWRPPHKQKERGWPSWICIPALQDQKEHPVASAAWRMSRLLFSSHIHRCPSKTHEALGDLGGGPGSCKPRAKRSSSKRRKLFWTRPHMLKMFRWCTSRSHSCRMGSPSTPSSKTRCAPYSSTRRRKLPQCDAVQLRRRKSEVAPGISTFHCFAKKVKGQCSNQLGSFAWKRTMARKTLQSQANKGSYCHPSTSKATQGGVSHKKDRENTLRMDFRKIFKGSLSSSAKPQAHVARGSTKQENMRKFLSHGTRHCLHKLEAHLRLLRSKLEEVFAGNATQVMSHSQRFQSGGEPVIRTHSQVANIRRYRSTGHRTLQVVALEAESQVKGTALFEGIGK